VLSKNFRSPDNCKNLAAFPPTEDLPPYCPWVEEIIQEREIMGLASSKITIPEEKGGGIFDRKGACEGKHPTASKLMSGVQALTKNST